MIQRGKRKAFFESDVRPIYTEVMKLKKVVCTATFVCLLVCLAGCSADKESGKEATESLLQRKRILIIRQFMQSGKKPTEIKLWIP